MQDHSLSLAKGIAVRIALLFGIVAVVIGIAAAAYTAHAQSATTALTVTSVTMSTPLGPNGTLASVRSFAITFSQPATAVYMVVTPTTGTDRRTIRAAYTGPRSATQTQFNINVYNLRGNTSYAYTIYGTSVTDKEIVAKHTGTFSVGDTTAFTVRGLSATKPIVAGKANETARNINVMFSAPAKDVVLTLYRMPQNTLVKTLSAADQAGQRTYAFTVSDLSYGSTYRYQVDGKSVADDRLARRSSMFTTIASPLTPGWPVISSVWYNRTSSSAVTFTWRTNTPSFSRVCIRESAESASTWQRCVDSATGGSAKQEFSASFTDLTPSTGYDFVVHAKPSVEHTYDDSKSMWGISYFKTLDGPVGTALPVISDVAYERRAVSAIFTWSTDVPSLSRICLSEMVQGNPTPVWMRCTEAGDGQTLRQQFSVHFEGLKPSTGYSYAVYAKRIASASYDNPAQATKWGIAYFETLATWAPPLPPDLTITGVDCTTQSGPTHFLCNVSYVNRGGTYGPAKAYLRVYGTRIDPTTQTIYRQNAQIVEVPVTDVIYRSSSSASTYLKFQPYTFAPGATFEDTLTFDIDNHTLDSSLANLVTESNEANNSFVKKIFMVNGKLTDGPTAGTLTTAIDASTPDSDITMAGASLVTFTVVRLTASGEDVKVNQVAFTRTSNNTGADSSMGKVYLYDGALLLGEGTIGSGSKVVFDIANKNYVVAANTSRKVTVKADLAPASQTGGGLSGRSEAFDIAATSDITGVGMTSNAAITGSGAALGNDIVIRKTKPVIIFVLPTAGESVMTNGTRVIYRFKIAAQAAGDVSFKKLLFSIASTDPANGGTLSLTSPALYDVSDSLAIPVTFDDGLGGANYLGQGKMVMEFNGEEVIEAATTHDYRLEGTLSGVDPAAVLQVRMAADSSSAVITGYLDDSASNLVVLDSARSGSGTETTSSYIWSDWSAPFTIRQSIDGIATAHSDDVTGVGSGDWTNGYLLRTLPTSIFSQVAPST